MALTFIDVAAALLVTRTKVIPPEIDRFRGKTHRCPTVGITMKVSNKGALSVYGIGALSGDSVRGAGALGGLSHHQTHASDVLGLHGRYFFNN